MNRAGSGGWLVHRLANTLAFERRCRGPVPGRVSSRDKGDPLATAGKRRSERGGVRQVRRTSKRRARPTQPGDRLSQQKRQPFWRPAPAARERPPPPQARPLGAGGIDALGASSYLRDGALARYPPGGDLPPPGVFFPRRLS